MSTDLYTKLKNLAHAYVQSYDGPPPWDPDKVWQHRSEDCVQSLHPKESLPEAYAGDLNKDQFYHALHFFGGALSKSEFKPGETVVDVEQRKVVVHIDAKLDLKAVGEEPEEKEWPATYWVIVKTDEAVENIVRVDEFMNTGRLMEYVMPKARKAMEAKQQGE